MQPRPMALRGVRPSRVSMFSCLPLLSASLALAAAPARADQTISDTETLSGSYTGNITVNSPGNLTVTGSVSGGVNVNSGGSLTISGGGSVSVRNDPIDAIDVEGGTVNISGGSVSTAEATAIRVDSGTVNISGGPLIDSHKYGIRALGGTLNISGGSVSSHGGLDIVVNGATVKIFGCGLQLTAGQLTGTLADGAAINARTSGLTATDLHNATPQITCPPSVIVPNEPGLCGAHVSGSATGSLPCSGAALTLTGTRSDNKGLNDLLPVGTTTVLWAATDAAGNQATCLQSITVKDTEPPTISGASATPRQLWPPNHLMVPVTIDYTASDNCGAVTSTLSVSNNETGSADATVVDAHRVLLLADRAGQGSGRVYTITITSTDASGNSSQRTVTVTVPHN